MRERTTWNRDVIRTKAANLRTAEDPRAMNQDHLSKQPGAGDYVIGGPSEFAEDVHPPAGTWKAEQAGGQTRRNEIGQPEFRADTFKTAGLDDETIEKKASVATRTARWMLGTRATEAAVEEQALAFMDMPDLNLIETHNRLATLNQTGADEGGDDDDDDGDKTAAAAPKKGEGDKDDGDKSKDDGDKSKKGEVPPQFKKAFDAAKTGNMTQFAEELRSMVRAEIAAAQGQPQASQDSTAFSQGGSPLAMDDDLEAALMDDMACGDGMTPEAMDDEMALEAMDDDIMIDSPTMDVGEVDLGPEDAVLTSLFASNGEVQAATKAAAIENGTLVQPAAPGVHTASTRTVGTRPTSGVSKIGSSGTPAGQSASGNDVDQLSGLWNSAPDVSDHFS